MLLYVHINHRLIRDGEPRTATSTFTQLLSFDANSRYRYTEQGITVRRFILCRLVQVIFDCNSVQGPMGETVGLCIG